MGFDLDTRAGNTGVGRIGYAARERCTKFLGGKRAQKQDNTVSLVFI